MFGRRPNKPTAVTVTVDCHDVSLRDSRESLTIGRYSNRHKHSVWIKPTQHKSSQSKNNRRKTPTAVSFSCGQRSDRLSLMNARRFRWLFNAHVRWLQQCLQTFVCDVYILAASCWRLETTKTCAVSIVVSFFFSLQQRPLQLRTQVSLPDHLRDPAVDSEQFRRDLKRYMFADIRSVSALEVLRNGALQIDTYLLTYLLACIIQLYAVQSRALAAIYTYST